MNIGALVLAAGGSRRFGSDKRFHAIGGLPMLSRTLRAYRAEFEDVAVVLRPGERAAAALAGDAGCRVVEAPDAARGQSRSLAAGVAACAHLDAIVVGLADMPFVNRDTLAVLRQAVTAHPGSIVRPRHLGQPGNPVAFPATVFGELSAIEGDRGARDVVAASDRVVFADVEDAGILTDVDHPSDLHGGA